MNKNNEISPRRMWLEQAQSDRSLDYAPLTPSRLPSPGDVTGGKKKRLAGDDSSILLLSQGRNSLLSPKGRQGILEISDQLKDLLDTLPSREKGNKPLLDKDPIIKGTKSFLQRERLRKTQSLCSLGSVDSIPTLPSRILSPNTAGEKNIIQISSQGKDLLRTILSSHGNQSTVRVPSKPTLANPQYKKFNGFRRTVSEQTIDSIPSLPSRLVSPEGGKGIFGIPDGEARDFLVDTFPSPLEKEKEEPSNLVKAVRIVRSPLPSKVSQDVPITTAAVVRRSEQANTREEILARIPDHVKNLLSMEQWHRILEPVKGVRETTHSVCSDITDDWSEEGPSEQARISEEMRNEDEEDAPEPLLSEVSSGVANDVVRPANHETRDSGEKIESSSWIETNTMMAYDALYCTEGESKKDEGNKDEPDDSVPSTSSTVLVMSKVQDAVDENTEVLKIEDHHGPVLTEGPVMPQDEQEESGETSLLLLQKKVPQKKERVSFGTVHVRWHERILVAHPCTSSGPSIGIGWEYYAESEEPITWNHDENDHTSSTQHSNRKGDLRLSRKDREEIIINLGYSTRDIAGVVREILKTKNQRRRTIHNLKPTVMNVEKVELIVEECNRKIRKLQHKFFVGK